jgi:hypothetical protein
MFDGACRCRHDRAVRASSVIAFVVLPFASCAQPPPTGQIASAPHVERRTEDAGPQGGDGIPAHLACGKDSDCALEPPEPCACRCADHKVAANVAHVAWLEKEYAREQCAPPDPPCPPCQPADYPILDELCYCIEGRCELRSRTSAPPR